MLIGDETRAAAIEAPPLRLSASHSEALSELLPLLLCGEESAVLAFAHHRVGDVNWPLIPKLGATVNARDRAQTRRGQSATRPSCSRSRVPGPYFKAYALK